MELAAPELIAELLAAKPQEHVMRGGSLQKPSYTRAPRARHCECGHCATCVENARWDAIFNAKFADPTYYNPKPIHFGSSLEWLARLSPLGATTVP